MPDPFFVHVFYKMNMVFDKLTVIFAQKSFLYNIYNPFFVQNSLYFLCDFPKSIYVVFNQHRNTEREEYVIEVCIFRKQNLQGTEERVHKVLFFNA